MPRPDSATQPDVAAQLREKRRAALYSLVQLIPKGKVASYGQLGRELGISPRLVGRYLHQNPDNDLTPCHRVVRSDGTLADGYAFGGLTVQRQLLEQEGVVFVEDQITKACFL